MDHGSNSSNLYGLNKVTQLLAKKYSYITGCAFMFTLIKLPFMKNCFDLSHSDWLRNIYIYIYIDELCIRLYILLYC